MKRVKLQARQHTFLLSDVELDVIALAMDLYIDSTTEQLGFDHTGLDTSVPVDLTDYAASEILAMSLKYAGFRHLLDLQTDIKNRCAGNCEPRNRIIQFPY